MIFREKTFVSKNGVSYTLRSPRAEDAEKLLGYLKSVAAETEYASIRTPDEMQDMTVAEEAAFIQSAESSRNGMLISVFDQADNIVGNARLSGLGDYKKICHRATMGMGLLKTVWRQGLGRKLMEELIAAARDVGYSQIELEVMTDNTAAIKLYESSGFEVYGKRPKAFRFSDDCYEQEWLMVLDLR